MKRIYVIGHKNPDTDSIASALAYAALKRQLGYPATVAAAAGEPNPQTNYILNRLGLEPPAILPDVHPKVRDIIGTPITAATDISLRDALQLFHQHSIRVLPVVDRHNVPVGMVSLLKLSEKYLVAGTDRKRGVDTSLRSLAGCLEGTFLTGSPGEDVEHLHLFVGAMVEDSFCARIADYPVETLLIMTGDRPSIQHAAIERGVRILVVTGGFTVGEELLARARERGVTVISTPHDTATASWLARLSTPLSCFMDPRFERIAVGDAVSDLRLKLLHSGEPAIVAVSEDGTIAGIATKSSLLAPLPYGLILVDHNELGQAVPGAEDVEIIEVIDHHKLGHPPTHEPITFMVAPVGSTCTVVASLYRERGIIPDPTMAGLMLAGLLSDTVMLKSPTTTDRDREIAPWLGSIAGLDPEAFGREIFLACSGFSAYESPEKAIRADFKHFNAAGTSFGVGQVEVVGFEQFFDLKDQVVDALKRVRARERLALAGVMITDIHSETTLFLADGKEELAHVTGYPQIEPHLYEMKGVLSRKKQMVPHLMRVLGAL